MLTAEKDEINSRWDGVMCDAHDIVLTGTGQAKDLRVKYCQAAGF